ncbi:MAG: putative beta-lysine N-acetyltransferase [Methanoregulaceae archaeon]
MPADTVEYLGKSLIQHGPLNQRVYVLDLDPEEVTYTIQALDGLALEKGYSKIIVKVPEYHLDFFTRNGYTIEAVVPEFFYGLTTGYFLAKFLSPARHIIENRVQIDSILDSCKNTRPAGIKRDLPPGMEVRKSRPGDAEKIAGLYQAVFETYPFPIGDPEFLQQGMSANTHYFHIVYAGAIIAAASFEAAHLAGTAEMTDFAVSSCHRGLGLSGFLLRRMEREAHEMGMTLAYTIARAANLPVNRLFAGADYLYGGTLAGNTNICGAFESMNVWYRKFPEIQDPSGEETP